MNKLHKISCKESWGHSADNCIPIESKCVQCGDDNDLLVAFTKHKVCGKCTRKNHLKI